MSKRTTVLLILDGMGIGAKDNSNPIYKTQPTNLGYIRKNYPAGSLQASGIAVGLPWHDPGSSDVGHMTISSGKVLYQDYPRISLSINDGSFFKNEVLRGAIYNAKERGTKVNLVGLISKSKENSANEHLDALIKFCKGEGVDYALHLFTDGIDADNGLSEGLLAGLPEEKIASISGRHFGMDIDLHYERTIRSYNAILGKAASGTAPKGSVEYLRSQYASGLTDENISPISLRPELGVSDQDSVIFFNYQEDSLKQMAKVFIDETAGGHPDYSKGESQMKLHEIKKDLHIVTFTNYGKEFSFPIAFPQKEIGSMLGKILADSGKVQLRLAESLKQSHVTNYFNGFDDRPYQNEYRVIIPSHVGSDEAEHPEMRVKEISERLISAIDEGIYDFILVNIANLDVIAHTGNYEAATQAIRAVDEQLGYIVNSILKTGSFLVITSDHGNIENMYDPRTGRTETRHNTTPVPIYIVSKGWERAKTEEQADQIEKSNTGVISDIAPTILELMGLPIPEDMSGMSLISMLR